VFGKKLDGEECILRKTLTLCVWMHRIRFRIRNLEFGPPIPLFGRRMEAEPNSKPTPA
jgi:hypothetical protein